MLEECETDHHTKMNIAAVAEEIYQYTSGYSYLVSTILYNLFLFEEELQSVMSKKAKQNIGQFVFNGKLDIEQVLRRLASCNS